MSKVGEILKKRRELEAKSLEEITTQTMIANKYLVAFEESNYDPFPGEVYAKGFLRNYANFLGFDEDEINDLISQYELEWQETYRNLPPLSTPEKTLPTSKTNWSLYTIIFILIAGILILLAFYITKQKISQHDFRINYPDLTKILEEEDIAKAEDTILEEIKKTKENKIKEESVVIKSEKVWLEAFASDKVWMQTIIDDKRKKEVFLEQDQKIKWQADKKIFLIIGNAGGVVFKLNDRYIGALGRKGEIKKILVTASGVEVITTHEAIQKEEKVSTSSITSSDTPPSQPTSTSTPTTTEKQASPSITQP